MATTKLAARVKTAAAKQSAPAMRSARPAGARPRAVGTQATTAARAAVTFETGSGNVFRDMGLPDAEERLAKAELARIVRGIVRDRMQREGWTQARGARTLGIAPADMSALMRGKLAGFSQERLAQFLTRLDMDVRIQIAPRPAGKAQAEVTVEQVKAFA